MEQMWAHLCDFSRAPNSGLENNRSAKIQVCTEREPEGAASAPHPHVETRGDSLLCVRTPRVIKAA